MSHREALHKERWFFFRTDCALRSDRVCSALEMQRLPKAALHYELRPAEPDVFTRQPLRSFASTNLCKEMTASFMDNLLRMY
jgi:hypothetical protein